MHPIYTNYRANFVETARGCVSSAFSPTAPAKLGNECAVPAWARPPRTAVGRNCPRFDCGFRVGAALVAARPSDRAAGGARSNQALPKRFSSCWRVSSMATGRPWGQYLLPGGPVHRGPREDFTSSGQVNCPCGKVFAGGENTWTRQRRARPRSRAAGAPCRASHSSPSSSSSHRAATASEGMRQSPLGERLTEPTLGPSGRQERLNCWAKKRR